MFFVAATVVVVRAAVTVVVVVVARTDWMSLFDRNAMYEKRLLRRCICCSCYCCCCCDGGFYCCCNCCCCEGCSYATGLELDSSSSTTVSRSSSSWPPPGESALEPFCKKTRTSGHYTYNNDICRNKCRRVADKLHHLLLVNERENERYMHLGQIQKWTSLELRIGHPLLHSK